MFSGHADRDNPSGHGRRVGPGDRSNGRKRGVRDGCHSAMPRGMSSRSSVHTDAGLVFCTTTIFSVIIRLIVMQNVFMERPGKCY